MLVQIFSDGSSPGDGDSESFRVAYLRGDRLASPARLKGHLRHLYQVMLECWNPVPELRKNPQSVMRDINQLLYRVFNSKKVHVYCTVDNDDDDFSSSDQNGAGDSSSTLKMSDSGGQSSTVVRGPTCRPGKEHKVNFLSFLGRSCCVVFAPAPAASPNFNPSPSFQRHPRATTPPPVRSSRPTTVDGSSVHLG